jgi:hypothetical protein
MSNIVVERLFVLAPKTLDGIRWTDFNPLFAE